MMNQLLCALHVLTVLAVGPGFIEEGPDRDGGNLSWSNAAFVGVYFNFQS